MPAADSGLEMIPPETHRVVAGSTPRSNSRFCALGSARCAVTTGSWRVKHDRHADHVRWRVEAATCRRRNWPDSNASRGHRTSWQCLYLRQYLTLANNRFTVPRHI